MNLIIEAMKNKQAAMNNTYPEAFLDQVASLKCHIIAKIVAKAKQKTVNIEVHPALLTANIYANSIASHKQ